ncbi:MAG: 4-hydroxythreonine-4-phosphate dehydrogenase PdxA [Ignavibacteria bacterium]|nr:4-hydroxythreonine-4-phosphate dehydrogenase PdxA [Ignavibacteria bacterium]
MKLLCTIGDCNGISLEVFFKATQELTGILNQGISISLCANSQTVSDYAAIVGLEVHCSNTEISFGSMNIPFVNCTTYSKVKLGSPSDSASRLAVESLEKSIRLTSSGDFDALITLPVSKGSLKQIGWDFPGQTEMIASHCNVDNPMMILCSDTVRVALATIHTPLTNVPAAITQAHILERIATFHKSLELDFALTTPSIAVLGLNPHAGEQGEIGSEEITSINPAIVQSKNYGINAKGSFPADGFFAHGEYKLFDGILAMYHDQGLIPLKLLATDGGVNFTAGLPIVRTSPDHGTAYSIAGKGIADHKSTVSAILLAHRIANNRRNQ